MSRARWHVQGDEPLVLTRRLPPRFDVVAEVRFPAVPRRRLAHQIRQDLWRALQDVRGFSPVVGIRRAGDALRIRAGGRIDAGPVPRDHVQARIATLLSDPVRRARWQRYAARGQGA